MAIRKIDLMHCKFGVHAGKPCGECGHFQKGKYHDRVLQKCEVYGMTHSEATDWKQKYEACGLFNKETDIRGVIKYVVPERQIKAEELMPLEGQIDMFME